MLSTYCIEKDRKETDTLEKNYEIVDTIVVIEKNECFIIGLKISEG